MTYRDRTNGRFIQSVIAFASFLAFQSAASAGEKYQFQGADITPLVKNFEAQVKTLTRPTMIYNWSRDASNPLWQKERLQGDPLLLSKAQKDARVFWEHYGQDATGNKYGWGLYGATDPVATISYGGNLFGEGAEWVLLEMELPKGFRLVYADQRSREIDVLPGAPEVLKKFDCDEIAGVKVGNYLHLGGQHLTPKCQALIKHVVKDLLQLDGFAYDYHSTQFSFCREVAKSDFQSYTDQIQAFVVLTDKFIQPKSVQYYHSRTKGLLEERRRIQTMFLPLEVDADPGNGFVVNTSITSSEAKMIDAGGLLWPDLEGQPKTSKIEEWIKENKFGCSGKPTTQPAIRSSN